MGNGRPPALRTLLVGLMLVGLGPACSDGVCWAGELEAVRAEVREKPAKSTRKDRKRRSGHLHDDCDDEPGFFSRLAGESILFAVSAPWWLPRFSLGDAGEWAMFPPAPYAEGHPGYLVIDAVDPAGTDGWSARVSSEYGTDFDDLSRIGTRLVVDTSSRFGVDTEWNQWLEAAAAGQDRLSTGDFNLVYRFAQHERVQFHTGVGVNWLADGDEADLGFNLTYGVDLIPVRPLVVSGVMDIGSLGDAFFLHLRSTAGVIWGPVEVFTGYDYQRFESIQLHGLLAGVRIWF